jgi:hypothetical protein
MRNFRKGEVAVLLNANGGRLFKIFRYASLGRWQEKSSFESQQPYALEAHETHLVKCRNEAHAVALVAALVAAHETYKQEEGEARMRRDKRQRDIIISHNKTLDE